MANDKAIADKELENEEVDVDELMAHLTAIENPDEFYAKQVFRVVYQTNNFLLPQIRDLINEKQVINLRPEYQRRLKWSSSQKSRLIESLLLNIPIPSIFLFESEAARYEVMDGQQRLNAIKEFMNNEFKLTSLSVLWPLNGMRYSTCPPRIKRGLDRAVVSAITLLLESEVEVVQGKNVSHSDIRRFIFDRLNTAGTRLNAQELRNAIYPGMFNELIIRITRHPIFTGIWGIPPYTEAEESEYYENPARQRNRLYSSMMDCQIVLRYFALRDTENIRGSMKSILDRCMEQNTKITEEDIANLGEHYIGRLAFADELFNHRPFELLHQDKPRLSVALYDAVMVAIDRLWDQRDGLLASKGVIQEQFRSLLEEPDSAQLLTGQANTAKKTKERIDLAYETLRHLAGG